METALKQSLLLTHGTIYGYAAESLPFHAYAGLAPSIVKRADQVEWRNTLYHAAMHSPGLHGPLTDNAPIDVPHWNMNGVIGETGLEWWQQCMTLFMRHI